MPPVQRIQKRNNVSTDVLRTDEEEREFKRSRTSSHIGDYSRYARVPQDQYQQHTMEPNDDLFGTDPYAVYSPVYESAQRPAPTEIPTQNAQHTTRPRQQNIVSGLGNSILNRQPFQEESDSSEEFDHNEDFAQKEDVKYETPPLFAPSSGSTLTPHDTHHYNHNVASDHRFGNASHIQQHGQEPYLQPPFHAQTRDARSDPRYSYGTLTHQQPPSRSAPSRQVSFDLPEISRQHASDHERARISHATRRERSGHSNRQRPEVPAADRAKHQRQRQSQPGAQDARETNRAHVRNEATQAQHDVGVASPQTPKASKSAQHHERANHHSQELGAEQAPAPGTRPKRSTIPAGFVKQKNILSQIRSRKSHTDKSCQRVFQEDLDYPSPEATSYPFSQNVPIAQTSGQKYVSPSAVAQTSLQHNFSPSVVSPASTESSSLPRKIPKEQLMKFKPDATDIRVWEYMHRDKHPMNWHEVKEILDLTRTPYVLEALKSRQRLYEAKRGLEKSQKDSAPQEAQAPVQHIISLEEQYYKQPTPSNTTNSVLPKSILQASPVRPDAKRLADQLEQERLVWATKEAELQQRIKTIEEDSAATTVELQEQENQLKLKNEVQEKYQKLKEEAQTQKEILRDEKALRAKAERELKAVQSDAHRRSLALAGATRKTGKATETGFAFSNDGKDEDGGDEGQKKTPSKRSRSRKSNETSDLREDGHSRTAGKSLPPAAIQALYKHLNNCKDEEDVDEEPPESIQEADLTYFVYTVCRKQWLVSEEEPGDDSAIVCGDYTYLNAANAAVTNEILRPHGTASAIKINPKRERSLHQGMGDHDMAWAQLDVPEGHVKVWVQRQLHTEFVGELPLFEDKGILSKTVFAVKQETSTAGSNPTTEATTTPITTVTEEDTEIYTTFDLANLKANEKVFRLLWPEESQSMRIDDINAREEARRQRKQALEDLEDHGELFSEEIKREDGTLVKVWVVQKTVVGPRN
ncbi:hypothetical protein QM012_000703 [Aureobasidium pullulans]|uniref:Uncharacterized protein n=1 Tax=Aureobasidium pullulans TaxID=5580 RepID=A0ABR0TXQ2_AURPU